MRSLLGIGLMSLLVTMLSACGGGEHEDIRQWMAESSRDLRGSVPPLPELRPFPIASYNASNQPDPFGMERLEPEKQEGGGGKKPDFTRPPEELERFPLEALSFIGSVTKSKSNTRHALILVSGKIYRADKGNYLGQNYGRIVEINDTEIVLVETVKDPSGRSNDWVERKMTLQLQDGTKGKEVR